MSNFGKLVEERISQTGEAWATAARIVREQGKRAGVAGEAEPERPAGAAEINRHPAHQGFISSQELEFVMSTATPPSGSRRDAPYDRIYFWLVEYRGGTEVPLPSYKMVRNTWDIDAPSPVAMAWARQHGHQ